MEAIRKKIKRNGNNKITIELPEDFKSENLDIFIFPSDSELENDADELFEWRSFSIKKLESTYNTEEPDYTDVMIKEPNPKYNP